MATRRTKRQLQDRVSLLRDELVARPLRVYHEDMGNVLWWRYPFTEPPYVGHPGDSDWPGYHTHWTPIVIPIIAVNK